MRSGFWRKQLQAIIKFRMMIATLFFFYVAVDSILYYYFELPLLEWPGLALSLTLKILFGCYLGARTLRRLNQN